jgi:hypothetical protein
VILIDQIEALIARKACLPGTRGSESAVRALAPDRADGSGSGAGDDPLSRSVFSLAVAIMGGWSWLQC